MQVFQAFTHGARWVIYAVESSSRQLIFSQPQGLMESLARSSIPKRTSRWQRQREGNVDVLTRPAHPHEPRAFRTAAISDSLPSTPLQEQCATANYQVALTPSSMTGKNVNQLPAHPAHSVAAMYRLTTIPLLHSPL